jgi:hypothetical protein
VNPPALEQNQLNRHRCCGALSRQPYQACRAQKKVRQREPPGSRYRFWPMTFGLEFLQKPLRERVLTRVFRNPKRTDDFLLESYDVGLPEQAEQQGSHEDQ